MGDKATVAPLADRLKRASSLAECQRIRCVFIGATLGSSAAQIAQRLGWSTATVHVLHSRWAREGDEILDLRGRGGRRRQHLAPEQEAEPQGPFVGRADAGGMLTVAEIQRAYERRLGKAVAPSTVYRLLQRQGWRKVVPRPRHPKADVAAEERGLGMAQAVAGVDSRPQGPQSAASPPKTGQFAPLATGGAA